MIDPKVCFRQTFGREDGSLTSYQVEILKPPAMTVEMVDWSSNPGQTVAKVSEIYKGVASNRERTYDEVLAAFEDMLKTKLKTPLEMIHFTFLLKDVSRAFTHQLVRTRIGVSYAQESMRFYGKHDVYRILITNKAASNEGLGIYCSAASLAIQAYEDLVACGTPSEDARGVLPTNILTNIFWEFSLLTFMNVFNQRVCCQAQHPEWLPVCLRIRDQIEQKFPELAQVITAPVERGQACGYNASFDRPCTWKNGIVKEG